MTDPQTPSDLDALQKEIEARLQAMDSSGRLQSTLLEGLDLARLLRAALTQLAASAEREARLRVALENMVSAHDGYRHGLGPCICAAHEDARAALQPIDKTAQEPQQ